jgi:hypothetical protein
MRGITLAHFHHDQLLSLNNFHAAFEYFIDNTIGGKTLFHNTYTIKKIPINAKK